MSDLKNCPFCGDTGFDLIGLKSHLSDGDCVEYNDTEIIPRLFKELEATNVEG